jgi:hypothetical protein
MVAVGVIAASALALVRPFFGAVAAPVAATGHPYTEGRYGLELDGQMAAWLKSEEGGFATADVVNENLIGADTVVHKHLANVQYEAVSVDVTLTMSKPLLLWMKESFDHHASRKNGAIVGTNYDFKEISRLTFTNAMITEIGFPELETSSKEALAISLKITPEASRGALTPQGGKQISASPAMTGNKQKVIQAWNFRIAIDGLDCTKVARIDPIVLKQRVGTDHRPGTVEFSNIGVYLPENLAKSFVDWHDTFVIKGQNGEDKEKNGRIDILTQNGDPVLTFELKHLGIFKLSPEKVEAGSENVRRVKAEMYVEQINFSYASNWQ